MRAILVGAIAALVIVASAATAATASATPQQSLANSLQQGLNQAGGADGAYVVDLATGQPLFSSAATVGRLPASVEKLYTTSTALLRFGPQATLTTSVLGVGYRGRLGNWVGTLYLRGGGDPTFGSAAFDRANYGTGATIEKLVANLRKAGITGLRGRIVGDESFLDSLRGTPATGYQFSAEVEGSLSGLVFDRGLTADGNGYIVHPAVFAAGQLVSAMRAAGLKVAKNTPVSAGRTPESAKSLAKVQSPPVSTLIALTNTPSDNFFAETLLKDVGARFGRAGSTAAGASVVRSELSSQFGIGPSLNDGSGLSRSDHTSPRQVVKLLTRMAGNSTFVGSLATAGETGTLQNEMNGTVAQGRCHGKTGTLHDVANLVGYCRARDGHTLAFAFLMNSLANPDYGHAVEANMAVAVAKYNG